MLQSSANHMLVNVIFQDLMLRYERERERQSVVHSAILIPIPSNFLDGIPVWFCLLHTREQEGHKHT